MPLLTLKLADQVHGTFPLTLGETLSIGRRDTNAVVIEDLVVSGAHAKIDCLDEGFLLSDLRSKNGTFVNGQPVSSHWLKDGDVITVGKHTLFFSLDAGDGFEFVGEENMEETMVLSPDKLPLQTPQARESQAVLSFLKGGKGEVVLDKKLTKIGKDFSNDIVISGFTVGQTAAAISKLPEGYYLSYVGGMSKPKVNGRSVSGSEMLSEFDVIEIGSAKMEFLFK